MTSFVVLFSFITTVRPAVCPLITKARLYGKWVLPYYSPAAKDKGLQGSFCKIKIDVRTRSRFWQGNSREKRKERKKERKTSRLTDKKKEKKKERK